MKFVRAEELIIKTSFKTNAMNEFKNMNDRIKELIDEWEPRLKSLSGSTITGKRNKQNRSIKQILGHLADSASNNTHRIVHLQYQQSPFLFPNYATEGNNDRWIAIQNYQDENWENLIQLWKYSNFHIIHVIENINPSKLKNEWISGPGKNVTLHAMVSDYLRHFELHMNEIKELMN